jgi:membrane-bound ClpP family serine protease
MSWKEILGVCVIVMGAILFLYGANYYNAIIGWTGFSLIIGGFFAQIVFKIYERVRKKGEI